MAGGGGGAWKVAYADFVTAMMAFFMVMWLVSQDQKVKDSVAKYFVDPVGFNLSGTSSRPADSSGLFESEFNGQVPGASSRTSGKGRGSMSSRENLDNETTIVADSILEEPGKSQQWQEEARKQLESARNVPAVREGTISEREAAKVLLARKMRQQVTAEAMSSTEGVYQDLISTSLNRVNFEELAEEVIRTSLESN
ncbi:MAG TPA: flagellar motor protein MotB [Planctomycetaceae bacterium]|nr:flagellar motor protein MotB [Planctomycetaceae bacterium]HQZ64965.1 flagellar motor protein MotB [Planctomycetaceae bacterium]